MIAGLHLCAVMTVVKTAGAVAEVGVAHPVPNPEEMTAAHLCVAMTEADPVTDPGVEMIVHPCAEEVTGMVPGMTAGDPAMGVVKTTGVLDPEDFQLRLPVKIAGMIAGMTAGLEVLLRRTNPQSVPPLSLKNGLNKKVEKLTVGPLSLKNNMYPYHPHTLQSK
jgi:hypothetical protein